ncbi:hypothetical protein ACIQ4Z_24260 [Peribacillus asahii]|uniref:hypothetical protein n=1 Tax=Peribacillus asahii TaxID=228899 RepID=UPI0038038FD7
MLFLCSKTLFMLIPIPVLASGQSGQFYPPSHSDYYKKKFSWKIYVSYGVKKIIFTQYDMKKRNRGFIYYDNPPQNSFFWADFTCKGNMSVEFFDKKGKVVDSFVRGPGTAYLDNSACNYNSFAKPSDYNEEQRKYKSDKFKKDNGKKRKKKSYKF